MTNQYNAPVPPTRSQLVNASNPNINSTDTALSTNILITVRGQNGAQIPVGAVQQMQIQEKRQVKMIDEVGTDGHIDSVPTKSTDITGSCQRIRFQALRVAEAFDRSFLHVGAQVYPFDIIILDRQRFNPGSQIVTVIKNVWITGIDYTYQVSDWTITDNMSWEAETIFSYLAGNPGQSAAQGGVNSQVTPFNNSPNWIEVQTDTGYSNRRGSLDAAGLIDIGTSNYNVSGVSSAGIF